MLLKWDYCFGTLRGASVTAVSQQFDHAAAGGSGVLGVVGDQQSRPGLGRGVIENEAANALA